MAGAAALTAFCIFVSLLVWVVRTVVDHRRWLRQSRVQVEVHTKLLDRLTSNEDLLAYAQTPAGSRFLESAPLELGAQRARRPAGTYHLVGAGGCGADRRSVSGSGSRSGA